MFESLKSDSPLRRVAIVGSGLAGLVAAKSLGAAGVAVTLYEKSRGPGGRMASKRLPGEGSADIGAQFFTIRNPAFRAFLQVHAGQDSWGEWQGEFRYQDENNVWEAMRPATRYVGIPRMSAITRQISRGLDLHPGVRIERLDKDDDGLWQLTDTEGGIYCGYDAVLLTPPPAQTVDLLNSSGLSALADDLSIRLSLMQACWTVVVHFPEGTGCAFQGMMPHSQTLGWAANNSSKPGRDDRGEWWVLHGAPDWSDANTDMAQEEVYNTLLAEFLRCSGITAQPADYLVHRWLYAKPRERTTPGHLWFDRERVGLIGDWLDGGRVEGAFNSASGLVGRLESDGLVSPAPSRR